MPFLLLLLLFMLQDFLWLICYTLTSSHALSSSPQRHRMHYETAGVSAHRRAEIRVTWPEPPFISHAFVFSTISRSFLCSCSQLRRADIRLCKWTKPNVNGFGAKQNGSCWFKCQGCTLAHKEALWLRKAPFIWFTDSDYTQYHVIYGNVRIRYIINLDCSDIFTCWSIMWPLSQQRSVQ